MGERVVAIGSGRAVEKPAIQPRHGQRLIKAVATGLPRDFFRPRLSISLWIRGRLGTRPQPPDSHSVDTATLQLPAQAGKRALSCKRVFPFRARFGITCPLVLQSSLPSSETAHAQAPTQISCLGAESHREHGQPLQRHDGVVPLLGFSGCADQMVTLPPAAAQEKAPDDTSGAYVETGSGGSWPRIVPAQRCSSPYNRRSFFQE
jgi:hypothetical protein